MPKLIGKSIRDVMQVSDTSASMDREEQERGPNVIFTRNNIKIIIQPCQIIQFDYVSCRSERRKKMLYTDRQEYSGCNASAVYLIFNGPSRARARSRVSGSALYRPECE